MFATACTCCALGASTAPESTYDESIFSGLADENCLNPLIRSEMKRISHVFKRHPCRAMLTETVDAG